MSRKNLRLVIVATLAAVFFVTANVFAAEASKKFTLDNGMTIVINELPNSPTIALQALVKTGSAVEGKYLGMGISHFVEHMLFKGTEKRKVGEIAKEARALGGIINASTSFDYTAYTLDLPAGSFESGLDILSDMLMNSRFDQEELEKEREVVVGEIRLHKDNPESRLSDNVFATVYTQHPYRHPIIGYEPLFRSITRDQIVDYYRSTYVPNNIVFSVAGNVSATDALEKIKKVFQNFKSQPYLLRNLPSEPDQLSERRYEEEYQTQITRMSLVFRGVGIADKDIFAMDVLSMILGDGESSRLYKQVYEKKRLVQSISASNFTPVDKGLFEVSAVVDQKNVSSAITAIKSEIANVKQNGIETAELEKAKQQVLSRYLFGRQTASDIAYDAAVNEAFLGDPDFSARYVEGVKKLTGDDIKRVANKYFVDQMMSVVILKPKEAREKPSVSLPEKKSAEIKKFTLDNGMTILLREDHSFPLVSMRLALRAGLREELPEQNGISNLTAAVWTKGTASKTSAQIAEATEKRGMSLGGFSGQNSFGINCDLLAGDLGFAIDLVEDFMKHPTFSQAELDKEKEQIQTAILAQNDSVFFTTGKELKQNLFTNHPYGRDVLGLTETISKLKRADVIGFYNKLCVPGNMVFAVFGDFDSDKVLATLKARFSQLKKNVSPLKQYELSAPQSLIEKTLQRDKTQAVVMVGFQAASLASIDRYGLEILSSILGSSLNGRIFSKIRDELGQSYTLGGNYTPGIDTGYIQFYVSTTQESVDRVKEILISQIEEIRNASVTDKELADTKTYLKGVQQMSLETNASLASSATFDELYGLGFRNYQDYAKNVDAVTKDDVMHLAQAYLDLKKGVVVITRQAENLPAKSNGEKHTP